METEKKTDESQNISIPDVVHSLWVINNFHIILERDSFSQKSEKPRTSNGVRYIIEDPNK